MEPGKYYLFVCPFFMTYVGKYVRHHGFDIIIDNGIYFQRTGRKFGELCRQGLVLTGDSKTLYDTLPNGSFIPAQGGKFPYLAKPSWVKE